MGTPWLLVDKEMPTWTKQLVFRPVTHVGIGTVVPHFYLRIYPQIVWMQADGAGLQETVLEGKNEECQGVLDLGILLCTSIWRPQGDLNPCRRRERPLSWAG